MNYNTHTFPNGLRLIHLPSASPVVYCGFRIKGSTRDEQPGQEGLAHFCEHVTFKGTHRRSALQVLNRLERVGGDLQAFTTKDDTTFYAAVLREHVERAIDLLADIVFHSTYPAPELEKEKEVVCDEIESYNDAPAELIYDQFESLLFPGHPLGRPILGTAERVRRFSRADVLSFTRRHYRPDNAVFFIYGDTATTAHGLPLSRRAMRLLEAIPAPTEPPMPTPATPIPTLAAPLRRVVARPGTHQAHVMVGTQACSIHAPQRMPLYLLNNILGGPSMNARLNLSLRERRGLVYAVESSLVSYADTGVWSVYFGCDAHDADRCLRLVQGELRRLAERGLTPAQLRAAKCQLRGQIGVSCDHRESFALDFAKGFLHYGWQRDITSLYAQIEAVTADQLQSVAHDYLSPSRLSTLMITPGE